uniref:Putative regulator n=1 Tax=Burkholderia gladioli TaxID=28095 RepID=J7FE27_BURGA|nr:putative regulator [Burkholderia gladioli]
MRDHHVERALAIRQGGSCRVDHVDRRVWGVDNVTADWRGEIIDVDTTARCLRHSKLRYHHGGRDRCCVVSCCRGGWRMRPAVVASSNACFRRRAEKSDDLCRASIHRLRHFFTNRAHAPARGTRADRRPLPGLHARGAGGAGVTMTSIAIKLRVFDTITSDSAVDTG